MNFLIMEVGLGSLVVAVVDFLDFFLVVVLVLALDFLVLVVMLTLVLVLVLVSSILINSLLADKLIFCMRVFLGGGGTTASSNASSPDF